MKKSTVQKKKRAGSPGLEVSPQPSEEGVEPSEKGTRAHSPEDDVATLQAYEKILGQRSEQVSQPVAGESSPVGEESRRFAEVVRKMRRLQELSQEELAERAGLHRNFVGAVERGQMSVSLENAERLARALGARLKDLL